jgi:hypothetical protein
MSFGVNNQMVYSLELKVTAVCERTYG